jgi:hypothetical protein
METWSAGKPVIVNEPCAVTAEFWSQNSGGLYFSKYAEFREVLITLDDGPGIRIALGIDGPHDVLKHFHSQAVAHPTRTQLQRGGSVCSPAQGLCPFVLSSVSPHCGTRFVVCLSGELPTEDAIAVRRTHCGALRGRGDGPHGRETGPQDRRRIDIAHRSVTVLYYSSYLSVRCSA